MKDLREIAWLLVFVNALYALAYGVTINGRHYGVADCNSEHGVVLDIGADAGAPDAGP